MRFRILVRFSFLLLACSAFAQNTRVDGVVYRSGGFPAPGAFVSVCTQPAAIGTSIAACTPLAPLCASSSSSCSGSQGGGGDAPNPVTSDGLGNYSFYVKPGKYSLQFYGSGLTTKLSTDQSFFCDPSSTCTVSGNNAFTGNNTHAGLETFNGQVALNNILTGAGSAAIAGTFGGSPTMTGNWTMQGNNSFTGSNTFNNISGIVYAQGACVGDGVTNDTACLQNILTNMLSGQVLELGGKSFAITGTLTISVGNTAIQNGKLLKVSTANDGNLLKGTSVNNILIQNVSFDSSNGITHTGNVNDAVLITNGNGWTITQNQFAGSAGGGVSIIGGSENEISYNRIVNSYTNGIQVCMIPGSIATDHNLIHGNLIDGTTTQDGIFTTASCGSLSTANVINRNQIHNNTILNTADSPIEAGINSQSTNIVGNTIYLNSASSHGGIISRDSLSVTIANNTIYMNTASVTDAIALVNQIGATSQNYQTLVSGNNIVGRITRSCIYVQGSRIMIMGNQCQDTFITPNASGSNLEGAGVAIAADSTLFDVDITTNKFYFLSLGVNANFGNASVSLDRLTVSGNVFDSVITGLSVSKLTLTNSYIAPNFYTNVNTAAIANSTTVTSASDYIGPQQYDNITCTGTGCFTGTAPVRASAAWTSTAYFYSNFGGKFQIGCEVGAGTVGDLWVCRSATTGLVGFGSNGSAFILFSGAFQFTHSILLSQGIVCTNGELALSAGWQSTGSATVTAVQGGGQTCSWTITTGTTTAANPTITDTLTNTVGSQTVCWMNIYGGTHTAVAGESLRQTTVSATAPIFTANFTPTAGGTTYFVTRGCGP